MSRRDLRTSEAQWRAMPKAPHVAKPKPKASWFSKLLEIF
jgi:hypothetical protein